MGFVIENGYKVIGYNGDETDVVIPNGVTYIPSYALQNQKFVRVVVPEGVDWIRSGAFFGCEQLEEIVLPSTLRAMEACVFQNCKNLKRIIIPEGLEKLEDNTFSFCKSLTYVSLPSSLKEIYYRAFYECTSLKEIEIKEGVEEICKEAFAKCDSLSKITLPKSIKEVSKDAFNDCPKIPREVLNVIKKLNGEKELQTFEFSHPDIVAKNGITLYEITEKGKGNIVVGEISLISREFTYQEYLNIFEEIKQYKLVEITVYSQEGYSDTSSIEELKIRANSVVVNDGKFFGVIIGDVSTLNTFDRPILNDSDTVIITIGGEEILTSKTENWNKVNGDSSSNSHVKLVKR